MDWKTSNLDFFRRVGLQFFAETAQSAPAEAPADTGDTGGTDGFLDGFADDAGQIAAELPAPDAQDAPTGEPATPEEASGDEAQALPERAQTEQDAPIDADQAQPQEGPQTPLGAAQAATLPLVFNGKRTDLPAQAVQALSNALGADAIALLQKGMNYENRGAREIGLLDRYAQAGGYADRAAYLEAMERQLGAYQVDKQLERLQEQYPDTPADALRPVAERLVQDQQNRERQQIQQAAAEQARAELQRKGEELTRPWQDFLRAYPEVDAKSLPQDFFRLVNGGLHPQAAYERLRAEQLAQEKKNLEEQIKAEKKNQTNRRQTPGSMQSEGIHADSFLAGFLLD